MSKIIALLLVAHLKYFDIFLGNCNFVLMQVNKEYTIISPKDGPYTSKWGLENLFTCHFPDEKKSETEYSLLIFEGTGSNPQLNTSLFKGVVSKMQSLSGDVHFYPDSSPDAYFDRLSYVLKNTLKINHKDFFHHLTNWEQNVKSLAMKDGAHFEPNIEIFVKVFIFIRLGYITNYKKLADIFSMPISLYVPFEKLFEQKRQQK
ncbi:MAG: hypothetical protein OEM46_03870 [Ignavibacteria bacterium]|nr:hypothetical protein [Ignavibacteria bacterium]